MKLFNKLKLALLGSSLSIGVAVAINANTAIQTKAEESVTTVTDVITASSLGINETSYVEFSNVKVNPDSNACYSGKVARESDSIKVNKSKPNGIVTTISGGILKSISVEWPSGNSNRVLNVYTSSTAYSGSADLYADGIAPSKTIDITKEAGSATVTFDDTSVKFFGLITKTYSAQFTSFTAVWEPISFGTLESVTVSNVGKTSFSVGDTYSSEGLIAVKSDTDGNQKTLEPDEFTTELDGHVFTEEDIPSIKNKVIYNGKESEEFEIKVSSLPTFKKVTANKEDWTGTYLIVAEKNSVLYAADSSLDDFDVINSYKNVTSEEDCIKASSTLAFKITKFQTGYSIQKQNGEYIGNSSSSSGKMHASSSQILNSIEFDENGEVVISCTNDDATTYLRFYAASGQMRFRYYSKSAAGKLAGVSVSLYEYQAPVSESLTAWANQINNTLTCDNGNAAPSVEIWNDIKSNYFDSKISGVDLETIRSETGNANGTVLQQALAKYDYIVSKYGDSTYSNYLGRNLVIVSKSQLLNNHSISYSSLITIISILGVGSCIGTFLLLRRKKEN